MDGAGLWEVLRGEFPPHDVPYLDREPEIPPGGRRHLALVLAYAGGEFSGWQVQPGTHTLQGELEAALARLCDQPVRLHASGRTDAGVHALGQVASFATSSLLETGKMARGLRALLPDGLHLRALGLVPPEFHARYSAQAKTYDYYLWPQAGPSLFLRGRLWALPQALDAQAMDSALALLPGPRDLKAFASQGSEAGGSSLRTILETRLEARPDAPWRVRITATGFLRHVVRNLVGSLTQVGSGRLPPRALAEMFAAGRRLHPGPKAPPQGLYLARVYYTPWPGP